MIRAMTPQPPTDLNSTAPLTIAENLPAGSMVGQFNATDPEGGAITYTLVDGGADNKLFSLTADGILSLAASLDYETDLSDSFRTLPQVALNPNPGFEDGLTSWSVGGDGTLTEIDTPNLVQAGSKSADLYRSSGGYARLTGPYVQLYAGKSYTFSMDFRGYGTSMYSGDQFELHRPGGVSLDNRQLPILEIIGLALNPDYEAWF